MRFLYWVHVISSSQLSCLPSTLPSPLSSCLVLDANVIQPVVLIRACERPTLLCVHWYKPPSIYHSCSCFLLDKKTISYFLHANLQPSITSTLYNNCLYQNNDGSLVKGKNKVQISNGIITTYYINTNEIPGELLCKNLISSQVKISPLLWLHNKSHLSHQKTIKVKWFGSSLVFI